MTNADANRMFKPAADVPAAPRLPAEVKRAPSRSRRPTRALALALALFASAFVALWPSLAAAQTITLTGNYPLRKLPDGKGGFITNTRQVRSDDDNAPSTGINRADCTSGEIWQFAFTIPTVASYTFFDVWASTSNTSCADVTARAATPPATPQPSATCWRVARFAYNQVINGQVVSLNTSNIVKAVFRLQNDDDPTTTSTNDICYPTADQQPTRFYLHYVLIGSDGATAAPNAATYESAYDTTYDLMGPSPPTDVSLGAGGTLLSAKWTGATAQDKDFKEYHAYCFPKLGSSDAGPPYYGLDAALFDSTPAVVDSGTAETAVDETGIDAADTAPATTTDADASEVGGQTANCPQLPTGFASGVLPSPDIEALNCGTSATTTGNMTIKGLTNGQFYAVAIAAVDQNGNSGLLSNVACLDPEPTRDFFDTYAAAGGSGGGGYCAYGAGSRDTALAAVAGLAALALIGRRVSRRGGGSR
jgi:hypothetical protein